MTRGRLWSLTAAACVTLVVAGSPQLRPAALGALRAAARSTGPIGLGWDVWAFGAAAALFTVLLAQRIAARLTDPRARARRRWAKGASVAAIARETGLPQDVVRELVGPAPAPRGSFCRGQERSAGTPVPSFADAMRRTASGATI